MDTDTAFMGDAILAALGRIEAMLAQQTMILADQNIGAGPGRRMGPPATMAAASAKEEINLLQDIVDGATTEEAVAKMAERRGLIQ